MFLGLILHLFQTHAVSSQPLVIVFSFYTFLTIVKDFRTVCTVTKTPENDPHSSRYPPSHFVHDVQSVLGQDGEHIMTSYENHVEQNSSISPSWYSNWLWRCVLVAWLIEFGNTDQVLLWYRWPAWQLFLGTSLGWPCSWRNRSPSTSRCAEMHE